ncbi:hypothetical protein [Amphiplicatus metriothermophilus]|uniref:Sulfotransferase family protein n=1 Tax=Amphiplicatus metriothermophilus TaxID=1519374 RepID=A0A239PU35_9PROT|nr:hypothetical protein [Amphiplicatus metriothermophilus]MBB5519137.1 hypothetical protein [Amphiplicatus metriothermophilus]SNT73207.1 hypothetical protein SAMN06297382_1605 [Amphiplicatus metriothermophilus]
MASRFDHLLAGLAGDIEIYPHQFDLITDRVLLTRIPASAQSAAGFLDQRALAPDTEGAWFPWRAFASAAASISDGPLGYIFHLGHCGSTLISRLVEAASGRRALREPLPLRVFAFEAADSADGAALLSENELDGRLADFEKVWSRGGAIVKATSICNDLLDRRRDDAPAVFIYIAPSVYLAALLSGANSQTDLRGFAQMRHRRLKRRHAGLAPLSTLRPGELAAMCWLAETAAAVSARRMSRVVDFDEFLKEPARSLAEICRALDLSVDDAAAQAAATGPAMSRYAKAQEHPYDATLRARLLNDARTRFRKEIDAGLRWLDREAKAFPEGEAAMRRFAAG